MSDWISERRVGVFVREVLPLRERNAAISRSVWRPLAAAFLVEERFMSDCDAAKRTETLRRKLTGPAMRPPTFPCLLALCLAVALLFAVLVLPPPALAAPEAQDGGYVVHRGDTLANIAARLGVSMSALAEMNGILNANLIYVGQVLVLPGESASLSVDADHAAASLGSVYVIRRGDTLSGIASRHGTSVNALMAANGIRDENRIYAGQRLIVRSGVSGSAESHRAPEPAPTGARWIDIDLSEQRLTAYQGDTAVFSTLVSTGTANHPTPVGEFAVRTKIDAQTMSGADYYLPNVQYVMYFAGANAIHGTYWHNNFGHPMSHGCVNLPTADAAWLYNWASIGTPVVTHY
jgi:lipoprotein-anchoring transpeptidase ErfK/SrfK